MGERDRRRRDRRDARARRARSSSDRPAGPRWKARPSTPSGTSSPATSPTASSPRASRASRHVAAAAWIESKAAERVEDLADVLAYHYATALDLARAAGQTPARQPSSEAPALRFLTLAGERALGLDTAAALASFGAGGRAHAGRPSRPRCCARSLRRGRHPFGPVQRREGRIGPGDHPVRGCRRPSRGRAGDDEGGSRALLAGRSAVMGDGTAVPGAAGAAAPRARPGRRPLRGRRVRDAAGAPPHGNRPCRPGARTRCAARAAEARPCAWVPRRGPL